MFFCLSATGLSVLVSFEFELYALSVPLLQDALEPRAIEVWSTVEDTKLIIGFDVATTRASSPSFSSSISLFDIVLDC